jgi:acyl carrier protein
MPATTADLKRLIARSGVSPLIAEQMDPAAPLSRQGVDSITYPLFILNVEEHFGVRISDEQALSLRTLNDFLALLNRGPAGLQDSLSP